MLFFICIFLSLMTINITFVTEINDTFVSTDFENESFSLNGEVEENGYMGPNGDMGNDLLSSSEDKDYSMTEPSEGDIDNLSSPYEESSLSAEQGSFFELNVLISQNQGETLVLEKDYYFFALLDVDFRNGVPINHSLTIDGNGHTIDAKNKSRIFNVINNNLNVVFKNIVFINGNSANGSAIAGKSTFYENTAQEGGAIYINGANFRIDSCNFEDNNATETGGAIHFDMGMRSTIVNCTFKRNKAKNGGAVGILYSQYVNISNSTFTGNIAELSGGAIDFDFSLNNSLDNCHFANNHAREENGGAFVWIFSNGNITNSSFISNSASGNGGAIFTQIRNTEALVNNQRLINCNFTDNYAKNGGAIYNNDYYRISGCNGSSYHFINNHADENGGAVYCTDFCDLSNSTFSSNSAYGNGGAVYCRDSCYFSYTSFLSNSVSGKGGAIYANDGCFFFSSNFTYNEAGSGGAIYANNLNSFFDDIFLNNSAYGNGGAIFCNDNCSSSKCTLLNNLAYENGGAIFCNDYTSFYNFKFYNNSALNLGGAIYSRGYNEFYYADFINNSALSGSAIYFYGARNSIEDSTFLLNEVKSKLNVVGEYLTLTINLLDQNNYLNAIHSFVPFNCSNVSYWNGAITNTDEVPPIDGSGTGINFTIEIYDSNNNLIANITQQTNEKGQIIFDYSDFDIGEYFFKIYHVDDGYYTECSSNLTTKFGEFRKLESLLHFADSGSIVNLTQNYTYSIGLDDMDYLFIEQNILSINGNGYTINALNHCENFYALMKDSLNIFNCTFANGLNSFKNIRHLSISNCTFLDNSILALQISEIYDALISVCIFANNSADYFGSAIEITNSDITIKSSNFTNNQADSGGAIYFENSTVTIMDSNFINNTAKYIGGALYGINIHNLNLFNSCFYNNSAERGGAINLRNDDYVAVDGCKFMNNYAQAGAAILWEGEHNAIRNSEFLRNKAAITSISGEVLDTELVITFLGENNFINAIKTERSILFENVTYWNGTVTNTDISRLIQYENPGQNITVEVYRDDVLEERTVLKTNDRSKLIYDVADLPYGLYKIKFYHEDDDYYNQSDYIILNTTVQGDFGKLQFLLDNVGENGELNLTRNYTFSPGFDTTYLIISKDNVTINGNGYTINGLDLSDTIMVQSKNVKLNNISFTNGDHAFSVINLGYDASNCEINDCSFVNCDAYEVISVYTNHSTIKNSDFINSTGAGIYLYTDSENAIIEGCNFINNSNAIIGRGGNNSLISKCNFINNSYDFGEAVHLSELNNVTIEYSNFTNNSGRSGGAIYLSGSNLTVSNCTFRDNVAIADGGAIGGRTTDLSIIDSNFFNNSANEGGAVNLYQ